MERRRGNRPTRVAYNIGAYCLAVIFVDVISIRRLPDEAERIQGAEYAVWTGSGPRGLGEPRNGTQTRPAVPRPSAIGMLETHRQRHPPSGSRRTCPRRRHRNSTATRTLPCSFCRRPSAALGRAHYGVVGDPSSPGHRSNVRRSTGKTRPSRCIQSSPTCCRGVASKRSPQRRREGSTNGIISTQALVSVLTHCFKMIVFAVGIS